MISPCTIKLFVKCSLSISQYSISKVCYSFLRNLQYVYGSGNGNIHDYITRRNKTKIIFWAQALYSKWVYININRNVKLYVRVHSSIFKCQKVWYTWIQNDTLVRRENSLASVDEVSIPRWLSHSCCRPNAEMGPVELVELKIWASSESSPGFGRALCDSHIQTGRLAYIFRTQVRARCRHALLYYVSAIVRLTSIPFWVSGFTEGQGLVFYSINDTCLRIVLSKNELRFPKTCCICL